MAKGQGRDPKTGRFLPKAAKGRNPAPARFLPKPAKVKGAKYTKAKLPVAVPIFLEKMDALEKKMHEAVDEGSSTNDVNAMQKMKKMENRLMKHVKEISDQLDNKLDFKVYGVDYEMRTRMAVLQDRLQEKVQENNDLKERLGSLEYTVYKNAIAVAEVLKKKDNVIAQLKDDLEKLKDKK